MVAVDDAECQEGEVLVALQKVFVVLVLALTHAAAAVLSIASD